jgi:putative serine protease PepD
MPSVAAPSSGAPSDSPTTAVPASGAPSADPVSGATPPSSGVPAVEPHTPVQPPYHQQFPPQQPAWYGAPYGQASYAPNMGQPNYGPGMGQPGAAQPSGSGRVGKVIAGGLLALLLAGGGGVVGGLIVHASDTGTATSAASPAATHAVAPVINRSDVADIVDHVKDSVVSIKTQDAEGSGVILTADGFVLTNNHVVADAQGNTVQVTLATGQSVQAKIVGTDAKTDLAVVKAQGLSGLTPANFGDSSALRVGDTVLAIGSPLGLEGSVTEGIVSALNRTIQESPDSQQNPFGQQQQQSGTNIAGAIQTDAAINPGNSGGALVNTNGDVVGINTAIATSNGGDGNIGVGFAIPGNRAKEVADDLMKGQKVSHPYIGAGIGDADNNGGASVASVVSGSPAEKAGLKQGDTIIKAGAKDIHTGDDLLNVVQTSKVGDKLQLTVKRGGSNQTLTVTVGESS